MPGDGGVISTELGMSLQPSPGRDEVPADTARVARAAFPHGNPYLRLRDELGSVFDDQTFTSLFPTRGRSAESPARLALICVLQFAEGLTDRQAADAVRARIDWKYALSLELDDPGLDHTVLSEFRSRLVIGDAERLLLDAFLERIKALGLIKSRGRQRTDSTHVLAAVRTLNRLERVGETFRAALNALAVVDPAWVRDLAPPDWYERYERRVENYHLPKSDASRREYAQIVGADGRRLLNAVDAATDQPWLHDLPAVRALRGLWVSQFDERGGTIHWRENKEVAEHFSSSEILTSPYDHDARYSSKREMGWIGYKVHLTETCDSGRPM